jgi:hypothetical protein
MAEATLDDLLKYKERLALKNPKTGKTVKTVWVRILGDEDLRAAFAAARAASSAKRMELRDVNSDAYKGEILGLKEESKEDLEEYILTSKENVFFNEAPAIVVREDLPEIDQFAAIPDAPTLEEQERYDAAIVEQNEKYKANIKDYIDTKLAEVKAMLAETSFEELINLASVEYINIKALEAFLEELRQQQGYRAVYLDEACTKRGYSSIQAFKNAAGPIKQQIVDAYSALDISNDDIKN